MRFYRWVAPNGAYQEIYYVLVLDTVKSNFRNIGWREFSKDDYTVSFTSSSTTALHPLAQTQALPTHLFNCHKSRQRMV